MSQPQSPYKTFKLYKSMRCYGDVNRRKTISKEYVMESKTMSDLVNYIKNSNEEERIYTFYIEKYIYNTIQWRQLGRSEKKAWSGWTKGDLTTTWEKYVYDHRKHIWFMSNYRYEDEKVL